jgi:phosphoserine phosphatase RsbU/P
MSAPAQQTPTSAPSLPPPPKRNVKDFWTRVTEGMELNQLWSQFISETRTSYGLYSRELGRADLTGMTRWQRGQELAKQFFWAVVMKLSPARRVILLAAVVLLVISGFQVRATDERLSLGGQGFAIWGGVLILFLLVLEVADRVTMKRDLEIAREIQHWLVPQTPPQVPGLEIAFVSRPANTVAGDYYDVLPMRAAGAHGDRVLLGMADVAGKSLPAALLMATFQASLRTLAATAGSLGELVDGVNRYTCAHSRLGQRFTTAFLGLFDPATRELIYTNAGHNAPLLVRKSGNLERLVAGGLPLGIDAERGYESDTKSLLPGDLLVIFTDGVVEAENGRGEEYEEGRLISLISRCGAASAPQVLQTLMRELDLFVGNASQHDDITCMVVRIC